MKAFFQGNAIIAGRVFARGSWYDIDADLLKKVRQSVILEAEIDQKVRDKVIVPASPEKVSMNDVSESANRKTEKKGVPKNAENK